MNGDQELAAGHSSLLALIKSVVMSSEPLAPHGRGWGATVGPGSQHTWDPNGPAQHMALMLGQTLLMQLG